MSVLSLSEQVQARFPEAVMAIHAYRGDETATVRPEGLLEVARFLKHDPSMKMEFLMDLTAVDYLAFGKPARPNGAFFSSGVAVRPPTAIPDEACPEQSSPFDSAVHPELVEGERPAQGERSRRTPWPGQATPARFEVVYHFFSLALRHRIRVKVPVPEPHPEVDSLASLWAAADWFEREVWDMFGIRFRGHPALRRILMYESFEGHPLRKDYPVNKRQPLIGPVN